MTVGDPGAHGATVTGMHGCGVSTPMAADVAAATWGLLGDMHMPNGAMFTFGLLSMMLAAGWFELCTRLAGSTESVPGAAPNEHAIIAPFTTS
jgi:hypothetical protein